MVLVGFSMGGNISLKYLGANAHQLPKAIYKAIAISSPCNLESSAHLLDAPGNGVYRRRFMNKLKVKVTHKAQQFPNVVDLANFERIEVWKDFDDYFSAPINGYKNAEDLYYHGSAIHFMPPINVPVLILNAQNDPILNEDCSPIQLAQKHSYIYVEQPKFGGHVGFSQPMSTYSWAEERAIEFVEAL
ncbi:MAG: alpha/beta fold hydrolase [Bacteroidota bacterium]